MAAWTGTGCCSGGGLNGPWGGGDVVPMRGAGWYGGGGALFITGAGPVFAARGYWTGFRKMRRKTR